MLLSRTFPSTALVAAAAAFPDNPQNAGSLRGPELILLLSLLCGYMCKLITKYSPKIKYDPFLLSVDSVLEYFSTS